MGLINETERAYYEGSNVGGYQYQTIDSIITNFLIMFTGENKVIPKSNRTEVQMHAKRCMQEFSYDVFKTYKSQEIEVPPSLTMPLPQDYVNYVGISWVDSNGIEKPMYPSRITSNPLSILQDSDYEYLYDSDDALLLANESATWERFKGNSGEHPQNNNATAMDNVDTFAAALYGQRFGMDPEHAHSNGAYYIDDLTGLIHFSGSTTGSIVTLKYLSDGLANDGDMVVHKFAEDAVYKYILYSILAVTNGSQEYLVRRYKKSFVAAKRVAKIRLSNYKLKEMTQIMRGKSKHIKH